MDLCNHSGFLVLLPFLMLLMTLFCFLSIVELVLLCFVNWWIHLTFQLQEMSTRYEQRLSDLEERLKTSEQDRSQHEDVVATLRQSSKTQIERLQQEKAMVEVKVQSQENDIKEYRGRAELAWVVILLLLLIVIAFRGAVWHQGVQRVGWTGVSSDTTATVNNDRIQRCSLISRSIEGWLKWRE